MSYIPNIPLATDLVSASQSQINTNFTQANSLFDVNHYTFNYATVADRGKHRFVTFKDQTSAGVPATAAGEIAMYATTTAGVTQLFTTRDGGGNPPIEITPGRALFAATVLSIDLGTGAITTDFNFNCVTTGPFAAPGQYVTTFTSAYPGGSPKYLYSIDFVTAGGQASRVTIRAKDLTQLTYDFLSNNNAVVFPSNISIMVWQGG